MLRALSRHWRRFWCRHAWGVKIESGYTDIGGGRFLVRGQPSLCRVECIRCGKPWMSCAPIEVSWSGPRYGQPLELGVAGPAQTEKLSSLNLNKNPGGRNASD